MFIFGSSFITYSVSASTESNDYPSTNIANLNHLKRHYRNGSTGATTLSCFLSDITNISGIFIDDVNFTDLTLTHSSTTAFTTSTATTYTVTQDERNQRYKIYCPLSTAIKAFKIVIPTQQPIDGLSLFRIGRVAVLSTSTVTLSVDPQYPYDITADYRIKTNEFLTGAYEDILLGSNLIWEGSFGWNARNRAYESELWTLNSYNHNQNLFFFENRNDFSKAYLCRKRNNFKISWEDADSEQIDTITLREIL